MTKESNPHGTDEYVKRGLGDGFHRPGYGYVTGPQSVLQRTGARQERARHGNAQFHLPGHRHYRLGALGFILSPSDPASAASSAIWDHVALNGIGMEPRAGQEIPELLFMLFQGMFAAITPALLAGAIAERVKFRAFGAFVVLWVTFVYCPIAHWVWGNGWLHDLGASDFAGGFAVHISSGVAALAAARILGRRIAPGRRDHPAAAQPHARTAGSWLALVWLVRFQWRQRAGCRRRRRAGSG